MEQKNMDDLETWDLSCRSKQETHSESKRVPEVLDLSCKSDAITPTTNRDTNTMIYSSQNLSAHTDEQHHSNISDTETQSSFASTVMLSSSKLNSPQETIENCESSFYNTGSEIKHDIPLFVPPQNITMEIPFLRPSFAPLHLNNRTIKIPVMTSTATSTSSYAETLPPNNGTERLSLLNILNEPSTSHTQVETSVPSLDIVKKTPRPFKAYSKNPFPILKRQIDPMLNYDSSNDYFEFREKMLKFRKMQESAPNPKMRRISKSPVLPTSTADEKDAAYWEKRKKNNEAAKRSRDNRRAKEDELAIWATFLQEENLKLKTELMELYHLLQQTGYDVKQIKVHKHW